MKQFCSPHCHPGSLDTASTPEAFALRELELGSGTLTCTDHGSLGTAYETYRMAHKGPTNYKNWPGLTPIIGIEAYFRDDECPILTGLGIPKTDRVARGSDAAEWKERNPNGTFLDYQKYFHLTLHFRDYEAYRTGVRLISRADARAEKHGSERKPLFGWAEVEELASKNVTAGSSCLIGMVSRHIVFGKEQSHTVEAAEKYMDRLHHLFKDRFYAEVFPHRCTHNWTQGVFIKVRDQQGVEQELRFYFEKKLRTEQHESEEAQVLAKLKEPPKKLLGINNRRVWQEVDYDIVSIRLEDGFVQNEETRLAPGGDLQWGANLFALGMAKKKGIKILCSDDAHYASPEEAVVQDVRLAQQMPPWRMSKGYHRQSSREAFGHFTAVHGISEKEFEGWVDNSREWADGFKGFKFDSTPSLPTRFYPTDTLAHTKALIQKHGRMRFDDPRYVRRLTQEIDLLHRNGTVDLLPYFFIDEEVVTLYEQNGWLTGWGRGSAAGLLLSYLLNITHVDPIANDLSLDRFITLDRIKSGRLPDIDQDLPSRDPLVGWETDVVEFEAADGTKHVVPETMRFETDKGWMTIREADAQGAEPKPWWKEKLA